MTWKTFLICAVAISALACGIKGSLNTKERLTNAQDQIGRGLKVFKDTLSFPRTMNKDGSLKGVPSQDWTSGFYAANLWNLYEYTKDKKWEQAARKWTA